VLYDSEAQTVTLFRLPYPTGSLAEDLASHRFCRNIPTLQRYAELLRTWNSRSAEGA